MGRALVTAYQLKANGDNTKNTNKTALNNFAKHLKEHGVNDLRKVTIEHVKSFAEWLNDQFESGEFTSPSTPQNYLSAVNTAMANARLDRSCQVNGVRDAGLPSRTGIATSYRGIGIEQYQKALEMLPERLQAQSELQRELGLRFKESSLIDAKRVLERAEKTGKIRIESGTKGGRTREFSVVSQSQLDALKHAAEIQQDDRSMIPADQSWRQYQNECYRVNSNTGMNFHGNRHYFGNERYMAITGVESPVVSGVAHGEAHYQYIAEKLHISLDDARQLDKTARLQIALELGHCRVNITNNYLG